MKEQLECHSQFQFTVRNTVFTVKQDKKKPVAHQNFAFLKINTGQARPKVAHLQDMLPSYAVPINMRKE